MGVRTDNIQLDIEINGRSAGKTLRDLQNESKGLNAQLRELEPGTDDFVKKAGELQRVNTQITAVRQTTRGGVREIREAANAIAQFGEEGGRRLINLQNTSRQLEQQMATLSTESEEFAATARQYDAVNQEIQKIQNSAEQTGGVLQRFGRLLQTAVGGIIALRADRILQQGINFIRSSFSVIGDFNRQLNTLSAISGANAEDLQRLEESARNLGATTERSASEVLGLQIELSKLGFTADEVLNTVEAALDGATLAGTDLSQTAVLIGSTLRAFGEDADQSGRLVDILGSAFSNTALDAGKFENAISKVAPVARSANISMEETTALLGVLADNGIEASTSGTALRSIFLQLAQEGKTLEQALGEINNATDANAAAVDLFGRNAASVALVLSGNTDKVKELSGAFEESEGFAKDAADAIRDDLTGDLDVLRSTVESVQIAIGEQLEPLFRTVIQTVTRVVNGIETLVSVFTRVASFIHENRATIMALVGAFVALNAQLIITETRAIGAASGIGRLAIVKNSWAVATTAATAAQRLLNAAIAANPIGFVLTLIAGLVTWLVTVASRSDRFREAVSGLWDALRPLGAAIRDLVMNLTPLGQLLQLLGRLFKSSEDDVSSWGSIFTNTFNGIVSVFTEVLTTMVEGLTSFVSGVTKILQGDFREGLKEVGKGLVQTNPVGIAFTEGERLGNAFNDGYKKAAREAQRERLDEWNERIEEEVRQERERQEKLEEERRKEEERKRKEAEERNRREKEEAEERQRQREEAFKARENSIQEAYGRERAILERENIEMGRTEEEAKDLMLSVKKRELEERLLLLEDFGEGETAQAEKLRTDLLKVEQEITDNSIASIRARYKAREAEIEANSGMELLQLELQQAQGLISEREFQGARNEITRENLQARLDLLREFGELDTEQALKIKRKLAELDDEKMKSDQKRAEKQLEQRQTEAERRLKEERDRMLIENEMSDKSLEERLIRQMEIEAEFDERKRELELIQVEERMAFLEENGMMETELYRELELQKLEIQREISEERIKTEKREAKAKAQLQKQTLSASEDLLGATIDLLKTEEQARGESFGAIKAFEAARVKMNTIAEISEIWKSFAALGPLGQVLAVIKVAEATIRGATSLRNIESASFAGGGVADHPITGRRITERPNIPTQPGGDNILALVKRGEVVLNQQQQQRLGGAPTFKRIGVPGFTGGGLATQSTSPTGVSSLDLDEGSRETEERQKELISEIRGMRQDLAEFPRQLRANVVINEFEAKQKEVHDIEEQASL